MLFLTRTAGVSGKEEILIGDDIRVVIRHAKGREVKVGVEAPDHVTILRGEVKDNGTRRR